MAAGLFTETLIAIRVSMNSSSVVSIGPESAFVVFIYCISLSEDSCFSNFLRDNQRCNSRFLKNKIPGRFCYISKEVIRPGIKNEQKLLPDVQVDFST